MQQSGGRGADLAAALHRSATLRSPRFDRVRSAPGLRIRPRASVRVRSVARLLGTGAGGLNRGRAQPRSATEAGTRVTPQPAPCALCFRRRRAQKFARAFAWIQQRRIHRQPRTQRLCFAQTQRPGSAEPRRRRDERIPQEQSSRRYPSGRAQRRPRDRPERRHAWRPRTSGSSTSTCFSPRPCGLPRVGFCVSAHINTIVAPGDPGRVLEFTVRRERRGAFIGGLCLKGWG